MSGRPFYAEDVRREIMKRILTPFAFLVLFFSLSSSQAQENEGIGYDEILAEIDRNTPNEVEPQFSTGFSSGEFSNVAYNLSGQIYTLTLQLTKPKDWIVGVDAPYLMGTNTGKASQEMGNFNFRSRFNIWQMSDEFSMWIPFSLRVGQRGNGFRLASHHDTYRAGIDIDYYRGILSSSIGGGYQYRTLEEDPRYDIGDISDFHTTLRIALTQKVALRGQLEWYRVFPTKIRKQTVGRTVDWASVSPGVSVELVEGLNLMSEVTFPIMQSGTPFETDLAFGEVYYPQTSSVTWSWGLGANF